MNLAFEPIDLQRQAPYRALLAASGLRASDYSFINLWGWAAEHDLEWAWHGGVVFIRQNRPAPVYWAPVGPWQQVDWPELLKRAAPGPLTFARVPEALLTHWQAIFGPRLIATESRGQWDYLYAAPELIELKGNRFHKKKNLVSQFHKRYAHRYVSLNSSLVEAVIGMQENWCLWRDCEAQHTLASENRVIEKILRAWEQLEPVRGGALLVEERMVAYTVAERYAGDTMLIHFEKADPEIKGGYQAINQLFLSHAAGECLLVNREQDLDDEGLRKAKLSYNPLDFVRKFTVSIEP
jgi:hypothetical protein